MTDGLSTNDATALGGVKSFVTIVLKPLVTKRRESVKNCQKILDHL